MGHPVGREGAVAGEELCFGVGCELVGEDVVDGEQEAHAFGFGFREGFFGDVDLVGFDDIDSAAFLQLSTIRQPLNLSGAEGARRLCSLLRGERVHPLRQELPIELIARGSSASVR